MFNYDNVIDALRLLDAVLASVVFGMLLYQSKRFWSQYVREQRLFMAGFMLYAFSAAYTSFEMFGQDVENGLRSWVLLVANVVALYALARCRSMSIVTVSKNHPSGSSAG